MQRLLGRLLPLALAAALLAIAPPPASADEGESAAHPLAAGSISVGYNHTCVVTKAKKVRCWGEGGDGQLGYGDTRDIGEAQNGDPATPAVAGDVPLGGDAAAVAVGREHSCALMTTGAVRCWGSSGHGQLGYGNEDTVGDGSVPGKETPAAVGDVPLGGTAVAIAAHEYQTCAVMDTGALRCWGQGAFGKLGNGSGADIGDDETPADEGDAPIGVSITAVSVGTQHTCVLTTDGAVRCWGRGDSGQLGYGNPDHQSVASAVGDVPLGGAASAISAGDAHTCAVLTNGAVRCWGASDDGRLGYGDTDAVGDGTVTGKETPADAGDVPLGGTAVGISAGSSHTCAEMGTGAVRCWGWGLYGRTGYAMTDNIGDGTTTGYETPAAAGNVSLGGSALAVSAHNHTCAVLSGGKLRCWGHANAGKLGYGQVIIGIGDDETPASWGDVPVGALVQTGEPAPPAPIVKKKPRVTMKAHPKRDRRFPFRFRFNGAVRGSFAKNGTFCKGTVTLKLTRGKKHVATRKARVKPNCSFVTRVKVPPKRLGKKKHYVKMAATARFNGNNRLKPASKRIYAVAR